MTSLLDKVETILSYNKINNADLVKLKRTKSALESGRKVGRKYKKLVKVLYESLPSRFVLAHIITAPLRYGWTDRQADFSDYFLARNFEDNLSFITRKYLETVEDRKGLLYRINKNRKDSLFIYLREKVRTEFKVSDQYNIENNHTNFSKQHIFNKEDRVVLKSEFILPSATVSYEMFNIVGSLAL